MKKMPIRALTWVILALALIYAPLAMAQIPSIVEIHGFAGQGFLSSSGYNYLGPTIGGSSQFQEFAFNISQRIDDQLRVGAQVFARDLGELGNNEIELDWAFGDYRWRDQLGVRAGRIKMPFGLYNETSDFDAVRTSVLLPQGVYDLRMRDIMIAVNGGVLYGSLTSDQAGSVDYQAYYGGLNMALDSGAAAFFNDNGFFNVVGLPVDKVGGASLVWSAPVEGLRFGHTFNYWELSMHGQLDPNDPMGGFLLGNGMPAAQSWDLYYRAHVSSVEYAYDDFTLVAERSLWNGEFNNPALGGKTEWEGWYVQGSYRLNDWLELGSYYSVFYDDRNDKDGSDRMDAAHLGYQKDVTVSARFDLSYSMMVKFEGHFVNGAALTYNTDNPLRVADPANTDESWNFMAVKTSFIF